VWEEVLCWAELSEGDPQKKEREREREQERERERERVKEPLRAGYPPWPVWGEICCWCPHERGVVEVEAQGAQEVTRRHLAQVLVETSMMRCVG